VIALILAVAHATVIFPEDAALTLQNGQCPSGYPFDGLFSSCAISDSDNRGWRIGAIQGDWNLNRADSSLITFPEDFVNLPVGFVRGDNETDGCSIRLPGDSAVFQVMTNLKYAHYRMHGCAKPLGASRCKMVITDQHNRIVDALDFSDSTVLSCPSSNDTEVPVECQSTCNDAWSSASFKWWGEAPSDVIVRRLGDTDESNWKTFPNLSAGDRFTIAASDFAALPSNDNSSVGGNMTADVLPAELEFVSNGGRWIDVVSTECSNGSSLFPGQYFGDYSQYLMEKAENVNGPLCAVADFPGSKQCACEDDTRKEICLQSKGFVALPDETYTIGLVSEECGCAFDTVCLSQIGGYAGYFGSPWLLARRAGQ